MQQQLLIYFNRFIASKDEIDVIYIYFWKAFDSVPHNELLVKLWNVGITGTLWNWFHFYLNSRSQCVSVDNQPSNFLPVISGVPHAGKHTGSLLFLIFSNELPSIITLQLLEFAEKTNCFREITSPLNIKLLQKGLNSLFDWNFVCIYELPNPSYKVNGNAITESSTCKGLGIVFTNSLTRQDHSTMKYLIQISRFIV